jgi:hypothetical protein
MASQPGPWEDYARPATPRIVVPTQASPRTPEQVTIQRGEAEAAPFEAPRARATIRNTELNTQRTNQTIQQSDTQGVNFSDENSLRSQYQGLPEVRNYQSVAPMVQSALHAAPGGAGDLNIVYGFAKVMDPGSVVRESEVQMSQGTGSLGEQINGWVQRIRTGGSLPPSVRQRLLHEIQTRAESYRAPYQQFRKQYWQNAERYGFDPQAVVGNDIDAAYQAGDNAPEITPPRRATPIDAVGSVVGGAVPEFVTRTDPRESVRAVQEAGQPEEDTSGTAETPAFLTDADIAYNREFTERVNAGQDRETISAWSAAQGHVPIDDSTWQAIETSRRTGRGINWQPTATGRNAQEYRRQSEERQGAADRAQYAEDHPILSRLDTVVRQGANTVTLGGSDQLAGILSGRGGAYEHGVTGEDWRSRPLESLGGAMAGGARLPYGSTLSRQLGASAAYGAGTGFTESDGSLSDRVANAYRGGATGLAMNAVTGGLGRAFRAPNADEILAAGIRQDVRVPRYMLGRETAQVATGAVGATPGRIPLARAARDTIEDIEGARNRAAAQIGDVGDNFEAGRRAQSGARQWLDESERRGAEHFDRIPIAPRTQATLTNTRAVLSDVTQGLESNPRLSAILEDPQLIRFRDALSEGGLSWGDMKQFRSTIGRMIGRAQVASEGTHVQDLRALYSGLTQDMEATAAAQGPRALTMFRRANQYWRGREARREGVITDILGRNMNAAPEDTFRMINRWAQRDTGDTTALAQTMRSLPRDDANAVRATIFARMGRSTKGQQDDTGEAFSPFVFATQWAGLEPRAKALLVPNRAHRRNLDDIALLTTTMRRSERFTNTSNTGLGANLGMFTLGGFANLPAAAGAAASTYMLGRLLSSPAGSATLLRALRNPEAFHGLLQGDEEDAR